MIYNKTLQNHVVVIRTSGATMSNSAKIKGSQGSRYRECKVAQKMIKLWDLLSSEILGSVEW
jgi:hypothetical protein